MGRKNHHNHDLSNSCHLERNQATKGPVLLVLLVAVVVIARVAVVVIARVAVVVVTWVAGIVGAGRVVVVVAR